VPDALPDKMEGVSFNNEHPGHCLDPRRGHPGFRLEWSLKFPKPVKTNARVGACFRKVNAVDADRIPGDANRKVPERSVSGTLSSGSA
jgi:hypothetical protein